MENQTPPAGKSRLPWILAGTLAVLVLCVCIVGVGAFMFRDQLLALVGLGKAQSASIAPADTKLYLALDLDLTQAVDAKRILDIYQKSAPVQSGQTDSRKQFTDATGLDLDKDVLTWAGPEVGLFFTDLQGIGPSTFSTTPVTPNLAVAVGTRDKGKSDAALNKVFDKLRTKGATVGGDTYKGTMLTAIQQPTSANPEYVATVRNFVVIASSLDAIHAVIDASAAGGAQTLAGNPMFNDVLSKLPSSRFGTFYLPYSAIRQFQSLSPGVQPQSLAGLEAANSVAASMGFTSDGVRLDYAVTFDESKLTDSYKKLLARPPSANRGLKAVGADALFYTSGTDLKGIWDATLTGMDSTAKTQTLKSIDAVQQQYGVDVNGDLMSWLTGEYALAVVPAKPLTPSAPGVGILALIEATDKNLVETKMGKISGALEQNGITFHDENINSVPMHITQLGASTDAPAAGYGFVGDFLLLGGPRDALNSAVNRAKNPLADDPLFKRVQARLPSPNSGYTYLNVTALENLIAQMLGQSDTSLGGSSNSFAQNIKPLLQPIKAVGAATQTGGSQFSSGTLFILIEQP
jgi:hypothetical protein